MTISSRLFRTSPLSAAAQGLDNTNTIDQIVQHLPRNCRFNTRTGNHFETTLPDGRTHVLHAHCNSLLCQTCARRIIHTLREALTSAVYQHGLRYLVTLTLPGNLPLDQQSVRLRLALQRFLQEARRTFEPPLTYWWCYGISRGRLHIHLLTNRDLRRSTHYRHRTEWVKTTWHHLTGACQTDLQLIKDGTQPRVVQYLLLNLMQTVQKRVPLTRRYGGSRVIKVKPTYERDPDAPTYRYLKGPSASVARQHGIDSDPVTNGEFIVGQHSTNLSKSETQDASASSDQTPPALPLRRRDAVTPVPAGKRAAVASSVAGVTDE